MPLSVSETARHLGVSRRQVQRLAAAGTLRAARGFGGALVVDADSVQSAALGRPGRGRPWSAPMAWAALWQLSGLDTPWLTVAQRRRLGRLLASVDADRLVVATRNRATVERFAAGPRVRDALRRAVPAGYVSPGRLAELTAAYPISRDPEGDVVFHVTDFAPVGVDGRRSMPEAVVAVDLAASGDPAGLVRLDDLLHGDSDADRTWMTAGDVAQAVAEELQRDDDDFAFRMLARGVADFRALRRPADVARFLAEPSTTGDPRWDALLAASVRRECRLRSIPAPAWTDVPPLRPWWFPLLPSPRLAARTMQRTPVDFSDQGIWLDANALETR